MINEDEQKHNSSPNSWLWSDCKLVLRRTNPENPLQESYENLEAEVQLQCQQIFDSFIPVVSFEKSLTYESVTGYMWKKGIPLPTLSVKLQESYFQLLKEDEEIVMIYCELTFAYPSRKQTHFYLQEIKSMGDTTKVFSSEGLVQFKDILLKECSHQKGNNKFSLLIKICATSVEENTIILKTLISTAFYVFNSRIKRKNSKPKLRMKLLSPKKFMKPLNDLRMLDQIFTKDKILNFLRFCNRNVRILSLTHPLYLIYHYSDILKLYYDSRQVRDLYELLETVAPDINEQHKFLNSNRFFVTCEQKKTKTIKKDRRNQEMNMKRKGKLVIKTQIKRGNESHKKLLLITFQQDLIYKINHTIDIQKIDSQISLFQAQLQKQIQALTKIFSQQAGFFIEIDLLRQDLEPAHWKDIEKDKVLEAYSKYYKMTRNRLISPEGKKCERD